MPSDTRERLDEPWKLRRCFTKTFQILQRVKELEGYTYGHYVLRRNGSSEKVHRCCKKQRRTVRLPTYHVGSRSGAPEGGFPLGLKDDGAKKNEAAKRLPENMRRKRPHLKLIVVAWTTFSRGVRPALGSEGQRP